ncbi:MAG: methyltransferase [Spirochaetota bacterium]
MTIRATTAPGIEDVALREGTRLLQAAGYSIGSEDAEAFGMAGIVGWTLPPEESVRAFLRADPLRSARSLFHVTVHIAEIEWDGREPASLLDGVRRVDFLEMPAAESFRVSCTRSGTHAFQSPEVERSVGAVLQERYGTAVDLEQYDLHVKIDVMGKRAFCGYQLTGRKGLDRRYRWVYHPRVTLRTPIAYGMLVLSGYTERPGSLHDPFCGSGTILLEAAGVVRDGAHVREGVPALPPLSGSDRDPRAVRGARANLDAAGLPGVGVSEMDARTLDEQLPERSLDFIVTNPPFGIRLGRGSNFRTLYGGFLRSAARVMRPGGTLALLVGKRRGVFNKVLQASPEFAMRHVRIVEMGGVYAALFVLRRTALEGPVVEGSAFDGGTAPD